MIFISKYKDLRKSFEEKLRRSKLIYRKNAIYYGLFSALSSLGKIDIWSLAEFLMANDPYLAYEIPAQELGAELSRFEKLGLVEKQQEGNLFVYELTEKGKDFYNSGTLQSQVTQSAQNVLLVEIQIAGLVISGGLLVVGVLSVLVSLINIIVGIVS
ncbi:hypothetical protein CAPN008_22850 [Capnocytophaga canis]|uniref:hypothetical protein n=1 Tax=Capnocytophaga canis TaxID=1848903 RepID=UPI001AC88CCF|nr:hypothetical protein [Capnocytophaga canis]GIM62235.1 hypothetical protein CAPN008_22850 [Capnocytophaga canis]